MSLTSTRTATLAQADGQVIVYEDHVDDVTGKHYPHVFKAASADDLDALLTAHAAQLAEKLAEAEFEEIVND